MTLEERYREQVFLSMTQSDYGLFERPQFLENSLALKSLSGFTLSTGDLRSFGAPLGPVLVGSFDLSPKRAILKAYAEGFERMALAFRDPRKVISSKSYLEIRHEFATPAPEDWSLCAGWQYDKPNFPLIPFTKETLLDWTPVEHAWKTDRPWVSPVSLLYYCGREEKKVYLNSTSGAAFHWSLRQAQESALMELLERDAFLFHWRTFRSGPRLKIDHIDSPELAQIWKDVESRQSQLQIRLLQSPANVPVVCSTFVGKTESEPAICFAAASDLIVEKAVLKSLTELAQLLAGVNIQKAHSRFPATLNESFNDLDDLINRFEDHRDYYLNPTRAKECFFLFENPETIALSKAQSLFEIGNYDELLEKMRKLQYDVMFKNYDLPELKQLKGFVVKALCPQLIPLDSQHRTMCLRNPRFENLKLNLNPHPFA